MTDAPLGLRLVRVRVPLRRSHRSAHGADEVRDSVLVRWTRTDGVEGWGECPTPSAPGYPTGTTDRAWAALVGELGPAAVAGTGWVPAGSVAAAGALADAALDAALRSEGRSLVDHLGAERRPLPTAAVLAAVGDGPDDVATAASAAVVDGAVLVKVKLDGSSAASRAAFRDVVAAVRAAVGAVPVAADANGTLPGPDDAAALDDLGLTYLEQPLAAGATWDDLAALCRRMETPVALDESLTSPDAVGAAVRAGAADAVSVKPARLGGAAAAAVAARLAAEQGAEVFVGGMFELGIGRAAAAAVACLRECSLPTDLGPSDRYVEYDVCEPVVTDGDGFLVVPDGPGAGRVPDEAALARFTVDEVLLGR